MRSSLGRKIVRWAGHVVLAALISSVLSVALLRFIDPPMWSWRLERALFPPAKVTDVKHDWVALSEISKELQLAVIAAEDQRFTRHHGFDMAAISAAFKHNQQSERVRGGSTLSQQAAKNLFMWSERSVIRKGIEAWFTLLMELGWDKSRILEVYLNIVEFGPGIYGAEAAAKHYFGKSAARLTRYEASLLAAVLPNPWRYRIKPASPYVQKRSAWIRRQMVQLGHITLKEMQQTE
ncbi:monofunctional biosynthetic peptidoglycan transglycosylase [Aeromonas cavernicola]|uniref:Biosynthetic peptidoglycan transglycosylase n=1 Tax=Aeromonas cavernicola TaxID=1006623 RepID=A0A2H9U3G3_9GAMM|nr:monofunctional biosynthetic peptidoglycan transglycosylase [Aeromonas cavernicola]PJG58551.1 monofunctional biosynthetic peptidoglycan transglycosylase [Aeromonas cavernicola]